MYPYIHIILPSYAVMTLVGTFCVLVVLYFRSIRFKVEFDDYIRLFVIGIIGIFIGSKVLFILIQVPALLKDFSILKLINTVINSGYVYYGGLLGMLLGISVYVSRIKKYEINLVYDMITPGIPLFHAFGRIGCFLTGCCYGRQIEEIILNDYIYIDRIPTQLIEALFEILLFSVLIFLDKKGKRKLLSIYMISYSLFRFCIEFLRGDIERGVFGGVSTSQWVAMIILSIYLGKTMLRNKKGGGRLNE